MLKKIVIAAIAVYFFNISTSAQLKTNVAALEKTAKGQKEAELKNFEKAVAMAGQKGWQLSFKTRNNNIAFLTGVDEAGLPVYYTTENNTIAAATTGASQLWAGGALGLSLSGSSNNVKDKMAVWDGGRVSSSHVELTGRVLQRDAPTAISEHSTHVAGTMMASGVNPLAKGMAHGLQQLVAYDFTSHISEMSTEAPGLLLSNHSYGTVSGWTYNAGQTRWEFRGRFNENEDYKFGWYNSEAQMFDSIAYNAPYYLIIKSAGNNRSENGPAEGQPFFRFDVNGSMSAAGNRPSGISSNDGYDIVSTYGTAKNILTVGAIDGLPFGYSKPNDIVMSDFSSWGPTDDGRIKPDVVANGVDVVSSTSATDNSYASFSGTSMSAPNTTGSLLLLQEYYSQQNAGAFLRSATLKALAIHTAEEAGFSPGPDYQHGWGLLNVAKAATIIKAKNTGSHYIYENVLNNTATYNLNIVASGQGPLVATIVWTDPKASFIGIPPLNDTTRKLIHDLDMRISKDTIVYSPWILDPAFPAAAATTGDNNRDNVEKITISNPIPGVTYSIQIKHKATLERFSQAYSLIISGAGGQAYCSSSATSTAGARIDEFSFGGILKTNPAGCTNYTNNTNLTASAQPSATLPFSVKVGSCDASITDKMVKIFIDYNSNGNFSDPGEEVAASGVINGNGTYTGNIVTPGNITPGFSTIMRIIVQQTNSAGSVLACGSYTNGETQDYRLTFAAPANDIGFVETVIPGAGTCASTNALAVVRIKNNGANTASNIPLTLVVKDGPTTVATLTGAIPNVAAGEVFTYTFQSGFTTVAGKTYSITGTANSGADQNRGNDTLRTSITVASPASPTGAAEICGNSVTLRVANANSNLNYFWYPNATTDLSLAYGPNANTATITGNSTYYLASGASGNLGVTSRTVYNGGGGYLTSPGGNYISFNAAVPVILESAKLYIRWPGKIEFMLADIVSTNPQTGGYSYLPISSTIVDVYATSSTPGMGQEPYDGTDTGAVFHFGMALPQGNHVIIVRPIDSANIFRNNNVTGSPYPFVLPNVISITGNSVGIAQPANEQNFYYYLYNMKIRTLECASSRTAIVAGNIPTPTITQAGDSLISSATANNQWLLNGSVINGATGKVYKPTQAGNYTVTVSGNLACVQTSNTINFVLTSLVNTPATEIDLSVSPNPSNGSFLVKLKVVERKDLSIEVINTAGQNVYKRHRPNFVGTFTEPVHLKELAAGVYVLRVIHGNKHYTKKLVVE